MFAFFMPVSQAAGRGFPFLMTVITMCGSCTCIPKTGIYHYLHMAEGNFREYLKGEMVLAKKYFYVLFERVQGKRILWPTKAMSSSPVIPPHFLSNPSTNRVTQLLG